MNDQMTPTEMREQADRLRDATAAVPRWMQSDIIACADALDRLAAVIEYAEPFAGKRFAGFAAMWDAHPEMVEVVRIARGETNERETT